MKNSIILFFVVIASVIFVLSCGIVGFNDSSTLIEVTIGKQVWSQRNLDVSNFRNGEPIPEARTIGEWLAYGQAGEAAWCYFQNDPKNGDKYGKLYNWYAVNDPRGLAPRGWHIPTDAEWTELTDYLGGEEKAGVKMKSKEGWSTDGNGTNSSGFQCLPGGSRDKNGSFDQTDKFGYFWSSTENDNIAAWDRFFSYEYMSVHRYDYFKESGFSIRCVRDK